MDVKEANELLLKALFDNNGYASIPVFDNDSFNVCLDGEFSASELIQVAEILNGLKKT